MRTARPHWPPHTHMQHWWSATPDLLLFQAFFFRSFEVLKWSVHVLPSHPLCQEIAMTEMNCSAIITSAHRRFRLAPPIGWISCQVATTSSALHNDHRVAGHCLPKFMALKTWPTSQHPISRPLIRFRIFSCMGWNEIKIWHVTNVNFGQEVILCSKISKPWGLTTPDTCYSFLYFLFIHLRLVGSVTWHTKLILITSAVYIQFRPLASSSVNFFQFLWSKKSTDWFVIISFQISYCTLPLRPLKSSGGVVPPATPPSPVALLRPAGAPRHAARDGAQGRAPA